MLSAPQRLGSFSLSLTLNRPLAAPLLAQTAGGLPVIHSIHRFPLPRCLYANPAVINRVPLFLFHPACKYFFPLPPHTPSWRKMVAPLWAWYVTGFILFKGCFFFPPSPRPLLPNTVGIRCYCIWIHLNVIGLLSCVSCTVLSRTLSSPVFLFAVVWIICYAPRVSSASVLVPVLFLLSEL